MLTTSFCPGAMLPKALCVLLLLISGHLTSADAHADDTSIGARLQKRVQQLPSDANSWRLLGRWQLRNGDAAAARTSLLQAIDLNPELVAAHFDLATALQQLGHTAEATEHFATVIRLAPDCDYATQAEAKLLEADATAISPVQQAGYEIRRFDGSEHLSDVPETPQEAVAPKLWHFRMEIGSVFNSNPALAPISRGLTPTTPESFQAVVTPELELRLFEHPKLTLGTMMRGSFTHNEGNVRSLNLQSYQPGLFAEKVFLQPDAVLVSRVEYSFSHDEFDTKTLGNRHTVFASLARVKPTGSMTFGYLSTDHSNFSNDGISPQITSQDGWTWATGASQKFAIDRHWLRSFRVGADVTYADLAGADFRFAGVSLFVDAEIPLTETITLKPEGGWGYRDYFDFTGSPSRNENIWRGGVRLEKRINDLLTIAGVFNYEKFATRNALFAADRYTTGLLAIFEY